MVVLMRFDEGTVSNAARMHHMAEVVSARADTSPVVIVPALRGVEALLQQAARLAGSRDEEGAGAAIEEIVHRHRAAEEAIEDGRVRSSLQRRCEGIYSEVRLLLRASALLGETTGRSRDAICAAGARLSSHLTAAVLLERGVNARRVDTRRVLVTEGPAEGGAVRADETAERCVSEIVPLIGVGKVPVLGGGIGSGPEGITVTLGPDGIDRTAAILASVLGAGEVQLWTSGKGIMMSADPELTDSAHPIDEVSFAEAAEMAGATGGLPQPGAILPALDRDIPVRLLDPGRPEAPGTLIRRERGSGESGPRAITCRRGLRLVTVTTTRMLDEENFPAHVLGRLTHYAGSADLVARSAVSVSAAVPSDAALDAFREEFSDAGLVRVDEDMAVVSVVGEGLSGRRGLPSDAAGALKDVEIRLISLGAAGLSLSCVLSEDDAGPAVRLLHEALLEN